MDSFVGTFLLIYRYFLSKMYIHFGRFIMTFAVQRYRNNFSKIYDLFLKDIGTVFQSYRNEKSMTDDR